MTSSRWLLLAALVLAGCSDDPVASNDQGNGQRCKPRDTVFCVCANGTHGTKQCSSTGNSFGPCTDCQGDTPPDGCEPGSVSPCLCENGSEGIHTCQDDGLSFDACTQCLGGGGSSSDAAEKCPGESIAVGPGQEISRDGSTALAIDDVVASCSAMPGPDLVYRIQPSAEGTLTVRVTGQDGYDPVLLVWTGACNASTPQCADSTGSNNLEEISLPTSGSAPVFVGVDSNELGGSFSLTVQLEGSSSQGDSCPGSPLALGPTVPVEVSGTTTGATGDYTGTQTCAISGGPDVVYAVQVSSSGQLTARLTPTDTHDVVLYVREGDCEGGEQLVCGNQAPAGKPEEVTFAATAGQLYHLFVDGANAGSYQLSLSLSQKFCGDGKVSSPEQCDDDNTMNGDGCSSDCKAEQNPPSTECPGQPLHVFDAVVVVSGSTQPYENHDQSMTCSVGEGGAVSPDRFYQVIASKTGTLHVEVTSASFDSILYARSGACTGPSAKEIACDDFVGNGNEKIDVPVTAGVPVWIGLDGWDGQDKKGNQGTFALSLSVQ